MSIAIELPYRDNGELGPNPAEHLRSGRRGAAMMSNLEQSYAMELRQHDALRFLFGIAFEERRTVPK